MKNKKIKNTEVKQLEDLITDYESKVIRREDKSSTEFYDLALEEKDSKADKMYLSDGKVSLLNREGKIYLLSLDSKSVEKKVYGKSLLKLSGILAGVGLLLLIVFYLPSAVYAVEKGYNAVAGRLFKDRSTGQAERAFVEKELPYIPEYDPSLPLENTLKIASVGIETPINEAMAENYEDALRLGVWRVDNFGDPDSQEMPTILTAHRYGYLKWEVDFRLKNSFYEFLNLYII